MKITKQGKTLLFSGEDTLVISKPTSSALELTGVKFKSPIKIDSFDIVSSGNEQRFNEVKDFINASDFSVKAMFIIDKYQTKLNKFRKKYFGWSPIPDKSYYTYGSAGMKVGKDVANKGLLISNNSIAMCSTGVKFK